MNLFDPRETSPIGNVQEYERELVYCFACGGGVSTGTGECQPNCAQNGELRTDENTIVVVSKVRWEVIEHRPFSKRKRWPRP